MSRIIFIQLFYFHCCCCFLNLLPVLQHYPLFRVSDASCTGLDAAPPEERHLLFREKYDVLSKEASQRVSTCQEHFSTLDDEDDDDDDDETGDVREQQPTSEGKCGVSPLSCCSGLSPASS